MVNTKNNNDKSKKKITGTCVTTHFEPECL